MSVQTGHHRDMKQRYTFRIYPTSDQKRVLSKLFGCCRVVWNDALSWVLSTPEDQKWPSNSELQKLCITLAKQCPRRAWLSEVATVPLQQSIADLGVAFSNFFGKRARFPRFKKKSSSQSAKFTKVSIRWDGKKLCLPSIGLLKVRWSRSLPSEPSSVTILKNSAGQYHASFVVEVQQKYAELGGESIGVDLGLKTFAFCSDGSYYKSPDYSKLNKKIARFQRKLSRQVRGSSRYGKTRLKIAKLKLKIRNIRKDFLHKLSTKLVRENQVVSLETLKVSNLLKNRRLSRAISEQGWSEFRVMCESKANTHVNREVVTISQWEPTSQICSDCGYRWGKLDLSVRTVTCLVCRAVHDRDGNAAKNIDRVGVGHSHDIKRVMNSGKSQQLCNETALLSHPYEVS